MWGVIGHIPGSRRPLRPVLSRPASFVTRDSGTRQGRHLGCTLAKLVPVLRPSLPTCTSPVSSTHRRYRAPPRRLAPVTWTRHSRGPHKPTLRPSVLCRTLFSSSHLPGPPESVSPERRCPVRLLGNPRSGSPCRVGRVLDKVGGPVPLRPKREQGRSFGRDSQNRSLCTSGLRGDGFWTCSREVDGQ